MGPLARRGDRAQQITTRIAISDGNATTARNALHGAEARIAEIQNSAVGPNAWEAEHPKVREQFDETERAFKQPVARAADHAIEQPSEHLSRVLGKRPSPHHPVGPDTWDQAARAIEAYRITYEINPAEPTALGGEPDRRDARGQQHIDWRVAGDQVVEARKQLDLELPGHGATEERMAGVPGLMPEDDRERLLDGGHGLGR
jgi:hypothetical protein